MLKISDTVTKIKIPQKNENYCVQANPASFKPNNSETRLLILKLKADGMDKMSIPTVGFKNGMSTKYTHMYSNMSYLI